MWRLEDLVAVFAQVAHLAIVAVVASMKYVVVSAWAVFAEFALKDEINDIS